MYFFKFSIPQGADYPPDWYGSMPRCPQPTTVLMYNDAEGYGIASTEDTFIAPEVTVITEDEAMALIKEAEVLKLTTQGIYAGDTLYDKWKPEYVSEGIGAVANRSYMKPKTVEPALSMGFCTKCQKVRKAYMDVHSGLKCANIFLTAKCHVCSDPVKLKVLNG